MMRKQVNSLALTFMLLAFPVKAEQKEDSPCVVSDFQAGYSSSPYCISTDIELEEMLNRLSQTTDQLEEDIFDELGFSFWDDWKYSSGYDPILSGYFSHSAVGLTVWQPSEYNLENDSDSLSYSDWVKSHGVQLSLGFGEKEQGLESRFRFDYRWHEDSGDELFLQFEVPFQ